MGISWKTFGSRLSKYATERGLPISGVFELTPRCNFECKVCRLLYSMDCKKAKLAELTAQQWISIARQASKSGLLYIRLTGGEVFCRNDFKTIYEALYDMGLGITIYTNASLITAEKAGWLGKMPPDKVVVTVLGTSPEKYNEVAYSKDGYIKTMKALEHLKNEKINIEVKSVIDKKCSDTITNFKCRAGETDFWITWDGKLVPCGMLNRPYSFPLKTGFEKAWREIKKGYDKVLECENCLECNGWEVCIPCLRRTEAVQLQEA